MDGERMCNTEDWVHVHEKKLYLQMSQGFWQVLYTSGSQQIRVRAHSTDQEGRNAIVEAFESSICFKNYQNI